MTAEVRREAGGLATREVATLSAFSQRGLCGFWV